MKKTFLTLLFTIFVLTISAQIKIELGPQFNGPSGDDFSSGVGAIFEGRYMVTKSLGIGASIGYQHLNMKAGWESRWYKQWGYVYSDANYNIMPIHLTLQYYIGEKSNRPYVGVETGITKLWEEYSYIYSGYGKLTNTSDQTYFVLAPQAGIEFTLSKRVSLDLNIKYNGMDLNYISLKAGLVIILGEQKSSN
jgi:hypothetical protein